VLDQLALAAELVDVVPAVVAERALHERRAEREADLRLGLAGLEPVDHVLRDVVALVDVDLVDAEVAPGRRVGVPGLAAGERGRASANGERGEPGGESGIGRVASEGYHSRMSQPHDLRSAGLKATLPRLKIINVFEQSRVRHMTAEDVYKQLLADGLDVGLATVYRVLTQFEQAGLLIRHHFETGKAVFELNDEKHHDHSCA
jgi:hypothetical protein